MSDWHPEYGFDNGSDDEFAADEWERQRRRRIRAWVALAVVIAMLALAILPNILGPFRRSSGPTTTTVPIVRAVAGEEPPPVHVAAVVS